MGSRDIAYMSRTPRRAVALLVPLVVMLGAQVTIAPTPVSAKLWKVPTSDLSVDPLVKLNEYEIRIINLINVRRAAADKPEVKYFQSCLENTSERWAAHLADLGELVHRDQYSVLKKCDLNWTGETLVRGTALSPRAAVKAWMKSPDHRAVIMKTRANRGGVGTKLDDQGRLVTVLNFGDNS